VEDYEPEGLIFNEKALVANMNNLWKKFQKLGRSLKKSSIFVWALDKSSYD
jgi:hypothetical protein